jgi:hypothetical protein
MNAHVLTIDCWHPARLNQWDGRHWSVRARLKRVDRQIFGLHARMASIPRQRAYTHYGKKGFAKPRKIQRKDR